jgi:hypothetical protein
MLMVGRANAKRGHVMAIIRGNPGQYTGEHAERLRVRSLRSTFMVVALLGVGEGFALSYFWSRWHPPAWLTQAMLWGGFGGIMAVAWWVNRKLAEWEAERTKWQKGDDGEKGVGKVLAKFPDSFYVINDISTPSGNLDHVVVGPTGIFILDAKNWRGVVQADGSGELLLNGKRLDKDYIGQFTGRIMGVKERICASSRLAPYWRGLFVFTAARVEALWGKTRHIHCLREDQLWDYIVERKGSERLGAAEVKRIADAFWKVAQADAPFTDKATELIQPARSKQAPKPSLAVKS